MSWNMTVNNPFLNISHVLIVFVTQHLKKNSHYVCVKPPVVSSVSVAIVNVLIECSTQCWIICTLQASHYTRQGFHFFRKQK